MTTETKIRWFLICAANVGVWFMLSLHQTHGAPQGGGPSDAIAIEQRAEMIALLKDVRTELRTANKMRQTGALPMPDPAP